jgi:CDP-paratose 2-epimerase
MRVPPADIANGNGRSQGASLPQQRQNGRPQQTGRQTHRRTRSRPVVITGGAGFIGTNVAASWLAQGQRVLVFDNLSRPGVAHNLRWLQDQFGTLVDVHEEDIRSAGAVRNAIRGASCVFHFAAQVAVTSSLERPREDFEVNALGTLNVLEACRRSSAPPPLLFTSTNKVYGNLHDVPLQNDGRRYFPQDRRIRATGISELRPLDFHSPYGCSKGAADQYVRDYARCYKLPAVVFRMSCIYGPHQCGTEDQGWVAHFARQILRDEPIAIYGDGRQVRDILFVEDLVAAMRLAIAKIQTTAGHAFNIGGGPAGAASLLEVLDELSQRHGRTPQLRHEPWRTGDQKYYVSDTSSFTQHTGWRPQVRIQDGLSILYEWLSDESDRAAASERKPAAARRVRAGQVAPLP